MSYPNYRTWISSRILENSVKADNGCIEYGAKHGLKHKYGLISITIDMVRKSVPAHRALWMAVNDRLDLPSGIYIRHKCDNPRCVNIEHLEAGTPKDNTRDAIERGRRAKTYKLHTRHLIHDDAKILAIKAATGKIKEIAYRFGVSNSYVSKLKSGKAKTLVA